jgi:hypothetical protein
VGEAAVESVATGSTTGSPDHAALRSRAHVRAASAAPTSCARRASVSGNLSGVGESRNDPLLILTRYFRKVQSLSRRQLNHGYRLQCR